MTEKELLAALKSLPVMRAAVENLENARASLTPQERILADLLFIHPQPGNINKVCELLRVEYASAYRRRKQVLQKLQQTLLGVVVIQGR